MPINLTTHLNITITHPVLSIHLLLPTVALLQNRDGNTINLSLPPLCHLSIDLEVEVAVDCKTVGARSGIASSDGASGRDSFVGGQGESVCETRASGDSYSYTLVGIFATWSFAEDSYRGRTDQKSNQPNHQIIGTPTQRST